MPTDVVMPALGMAQETGRIVRWLKAEGEPVTKGEPLIEIETDKVTVEIEAPATGVLARVTAGEGQVVPVGEVIALILAAGEQAPAAAVPARTEAIQQAPLRVGARTSTAGGLPAGADAAKIPASPLARRIAAEHGVDLAQVKGRAGRIDKADVLAYIQARDAGAAPVQASASRAGAGGPPSAAREAEVGTVWRLMAERTTKSWTTAPHIYLRRDVDAGRLAAWREGARKRSGLDLTYTDLLVRLVAVALRDHPGLVATWRDGAIVQSGEINIGVAVAIDEGLIVPVIHGADRLTLEEIALRRQDLVSRANAGALRPEDIRGGTFTISNLGMYGVDAFDAVINPPQAAILAVGRIAPRVVAVGGAPAVRPAMTLSLSCDHRVVDGARGARFLGALAGLIEEPLSLLG